MMFAENVPAVRPRLRKMLPLSSSLRLASVDVATLVVDRRPKYQQRKRGTEVVADRTVQVKCVLVAFPGGGEISLDEGCVAESSQGARA